MRRTQQLEATRRQQEIPIAAFSPIRRLLGPEMSRFPARNCDSFLLLARRDIIVSGIQSGRKTDATSTPTPIIASTQR